MNFTNKERYLLEDQKSHEEICIQKYSNYANLVSCPQLKSILQELSQKETEHYNTIDQLLQGQMPSMGQGSQQSGGQQQSQLSNMTQQEAFQPKVNTGNYNSSDKDLCTDLLMTEKYVSGTYDTAIFEFRDPQVRSILNHIQKEEQQHGETLFKYMESKGMYSVK